MSHERQVLGWHWFVDLSDCENLPATAEQLEAILVRAAELAGATIVDRSFHAFAPHGLSGVVVIAESHLAAHTWPEYNAACVDLFSCTANLDVDAATRLLQEAFAAKSVEVRCQERSVSRVRCSPEPKTDTPCQG